MNLSKLTPRQLAALNAYSLYGPKKACKLLGITKQGLYTHLRLVRKKTRSESVADLRAQYIDSLINS